MFDFTTMTVDALEARQAEIAGMETESATAEELENRSAELEAIKAELETRKAAAEEAEKRRQEIADGAGETKEEHKEENRMELRDFLKSNEYVEAYARYIKSGDDTECRALLTDAITVSGTAGVPVPTIVEDRIRTAWENDEIMRRVRKTYIKGNLKVGFELSATAAVEHTEGAAAPTEEVLNLGVVELVPKTLKKWITISDEVMDMKGAAFLDYIFDEIEYRIVKLAADKVVNDIVSAPTTATTSAASVANLTISSISINDFINAVATLSDEARNPVIIMNKATYAAYKGLQNAAYYGVDPFDGMTVLFNNTLDASSAASGNIAIVGDLDGVQCNFTNGDQPSFKYDDLSLAEKDLVKVVGRLPMAHGVTACGRFCVIKKSST